MDTQLDNRPGPAVAVTLHSLDPGDEYKERTLIMEPSTTIPVGRASRSTQKNLLASANNAYIDSPVVSRDHAVLSAQAATGIPTVFIKDLGSMHGTTVNNTLLAKSQDCRLNTGDVIKFGTDVVRDQHTFYAKEYRFTSRPYTATSTYSLDYVSDDEDVSTDVSADERSSSVASAVSDVQQPEHLGSLSNPVYLVDDDDEFEAAPFSPTPGEDEVSSHSLEDEDDIEHGPDAADFGDDITGDAIFDIYGDDSDSGRETRDSSAEDSEGDFRFASRGMMEVAHDTPHDDHNSDSDESNHSPDHMDNITRSKMLEMLDHARSPPEEQQDVCHSRSNATDPVTPIDEEIEGTSAKEQTCSLPTPPLTLHRPFEVLRPSASMSLKNIMHQEKDDVPGVSALLLPNSKKPKTPSRHPWDWSYSYDNPWDSADAVSRQPMDPGTSVLGQVAESDFTLTSSRFDNPYVPPTNMNYAVLPGKSEHSHSTCPPRSQQVSIHDHTISMAPVTFTSPTSEQQSTLPLPEVIRPATPFPPTIEKPKERTGMSILEIVEPTVSKDDEPANPKKRNFDAMEAEGAGVDDMHSTVAGEEDKFADLEATTPRFPPERPIKKMRLRRAATAVAGIVVGTVSAVGALAFLPDVFFQ